MTLGPFTNDLTNGQVADADQVMANLEALRSYINGSIGVDSLDSALLPILAVNDASNVRRGKKIIPGTESRSNTTYGTMPTPDQVSNVVLPTDGLIAIAYQALWQETPNAPAALGTARAAIFLGANQLRIAAAGSTPVQEIQWGSGAGNAATYSPLYTFEGGLDSVQNNGVGSTSNVATGQIIGSRGAGSDGGVCYVFAAAGTYTVSVQFKSTTTAAGQGVQVTDRRLWVWTMGF
jgi:hypothetical protein